MQTLYDSNSLTLYGINPLTGEADAYSRRVLCDLSEQGVILLTSYFGLPHTKEAQHAFAKNWNSMVGEHKAVASILLSRAVLDDLRVFALLHVGGYDYVLESPTGPSGFNDGERYAEAYLHGDVPHGYRLLYNTAKASHAHQVDGRNVHAMSGRVL